MKSQVELLLERGIEAAEAGEDRRARDIFIHVIELDQYNEDAWLWLSSVVTSPNDRIVCLENVLAINPDNVAADRDLQYFRRQPEDPLAPPSALPRLTPAQGVHTQICPQCGYRNPGWAHICDRCGNTLRQVDLRTALGPAAKPRRPHIATLLEAWFGVFTFDPAVAFLPERALASWKRGIGALLLGSLVVTPIRMLASVVIAFALGLDIDYHDQLVYQAGLFAVGTPILFAVITAFWAVITGLTWGGSRLLGGREPARILAHYTAVVVSAWTVALAMIVPLVYLFPSLETLLHLGLSADMTLLASLAFIGVVWGMSGAIWLSLAVQTGQRISVWRAGLVVVLVIVAIVGGGGWLAAHFPALLNLGMCTLLLMFLPMP